MELQYLAAELLKPLGDVIIPIGEEDYERLKKDIGTNGIRTPLHVYKNVVLCGSNRLRAAREIDLQFIPCLVIEGEMTDLEMKEYAILDNLARRHLSTAQKAELAMLLEEVEKKLAATRKRRALIQFTAPAKKQDADETDSQENMSFHEAIQNDAPTAPNTTVRPHGGLTEKGKALKIAAEKAGIGHYTVYKAKVIKDADPEAWKGVLDGERSINEAYRNIKGAPHAVSAADSTIEQLKAATGLLNNITEQAAGLDSDSLVQTGRAVRELKDAADKAYSMLKQAYQDSSAGSSEPEAGWCSGCMLTEQQGRLCEKVSPCPKYSQGAN